MNYITAKCNQKNFFERESYHDQKQNSTINLSNHLYNTWPCWIASIAFPLVYVIFLLIQAIILKFDASILIPNTTTPLIYPYFFVNLDTQGVGGVLMWIGILSVAFVVVGFLFFGLDRIGKKKLDK